MWWGVGYGQGVEASVDGVLGGYGNVSSRDVVDSKAFILEMFSEIPPRDPTNLVALGECVSPGRSFCLKEDLGIKTLTFTLHSSTFGLGLFYGCIIQL